MRKTRNDVGKIRINTNDIVGMKFEGSWLTVVEYEGQRYESCDSEYGERLRHFYLCKCDCGNYKIVKRDCLLFGLTKSCGCMKRGRKHG